MTAKLEQSPIPSDPTPSSADRLKSALAILTQRTPPDDAAPSATIAELCRLAGVSRNSLYRHHPAIVKALQLYQRERRDEGQVAKRMNAQLRSENALLQQKLAKLAALVDHYFSAYCETRGLLDRRERELAELRRGLQKPLAVARPVAKSV